MMKKLLFILFSIGLFSCVDDEGNYDYVAVNEITISEITATGDTLEEMEQRYVFAQIDTVKITLDIQGTIEKGNLDNYDFEWYICHDRHTHTEISREKDLLFPINLTPGTTYSVYFQLTDRISGLKWLKYVAVSVLSPMTRGFLILGDLEDGTIGLDMLSMPSGKDTVMITDAFDNSEWGFTQAEKLLYAGNRWGDEGKAQSLWMMTKEGSHRLTNQTEITYMAEVNDMDLLESEYPYKKPMRILDVFPHQTTMNTSSANRGYIMEDRVWLNAITQAEFFTTPVNRYSAQSSTFFKPFPFAFHAGVFYRPYVFILYDMDNDCFVQTNTNGLSASYCNYKYDAPADPFPWDNRKVGRKLIYGENSYDGTYGSSYALMKGKDNDYYIYKFLLATAYNITKTGCYPIDLSVAIDFDKASHYVFAANQTRMMYSVGSKLYMYDYTRQQLAVRDFEAEITYLEAEYCSSGEKNAFIMATYDAQEKGIIRKLEVGANPNQVEIIDRPNEVWNTRLKVKDIEWKQ